MAHCSAKPASTGDFVLRCLLETPTPMCAAWGANSRSWNVRQVGPSLPPCTESKQLGMAKEGKWVMEGNSTVNTSPRCGPSCPVSHYRAPAMGLQCPFQTAPAQPPTTSSPRTHEGSEHYQTLCSLHEDIRTAPWATGGTLISHLLLFNAHSLCSTYTTQWVAPSGFPVW